MTNKEVEFKYDASNIPLNVFLAFCKKSKFQNTITISGTDYFYSNKDNRTFYRIREDNSGTQLTFKSKTVKDNNFIRIEHNLNLKSNNTAKESAESYIQDLGYKYEGSLFKVCFIYFYDYYNIVYYVCYNDSMKELGRFVEIEMDENHPWLSDGEMFKELIMLEKMHKVLGLNKSVRLNDSLFEMYIKEKV